LPPLLHVTIPLLINGPSHHLPHTPDSPVPLSRISASSTVISLIASILPSFHISSILISRFLWLRPYNVSFIFANSLFVRSPVVLIFIPCPLCVIRFCYTFLMLLTPTHLSMMFRVSPFSIASSLIKCTSICLRYSCTSCSYTVCNTALSN